MGDPFDFDGDGQVTEVEEEEALLLFLDDDDEDEDKDRFQNKGGCLAVLMVFAVFSMVIAMLPFLL